MRTRERVAAITTSLAIMLGGLIGVAVSNVGTGAAATEGDTEELPSDKVFVCKYVGTPGDDERLQTGQNPISVSINAVAQPIVIGAFFNDAQGRSVVIAFDVGQDPEPGPDACPAPPPPTTTTTKHGTTTTGGSTTTASSTTTTTKPPTPGLFAIEVEPTCPDGTLATIEITFGNRPDLNGQVGTLTFSTGGSIPLTFISNATVEVPYPASAGTGPVTMTYTLGAESVTRTTTFPEACAPPGTTTTTTTTPGGTTTTTTTPGGTTTTTTLPPGQPAPFTFGAAATVCVAEVPTIRIVFQNTFPELAGQTGTLTMADVNGNVVSTQALVYQPNTTVNLLYPGTQVNADGSIADVPGWTLTSAGLWIRDPSDEFLREGINLTYTVNPTATAFVTYPPESSTCANPDGPFPPGPTPPPPGGTTTTTQPGGGGTTTTTRPGATTTTTRPSTGGTQPEPYCVANPGAPGCTDDGFPISETG